MLGLATRRRYLQLHSEQHSFDAMRALRAGPASFVVAALCALSIVVAWVLSEPVWGDRGSSNVLLITIDTLRADALGSYGSRTRQSRTVDALAARGVVFERALSQAPATGPSFSSMLTGRYPVEHTVLHSTRRLPAEQQTMAEHFKARGYRTGGFVSCSILASRYGFDQGFEEYDEKFQNKYDGKHFERDGAHTTDAALRWLSRLAPDEPFFAWVHYFDVHAPYLDRSSRGLTSQQRALGSLASLRRLQKEPQARAEALPIIRELYASEVGYVDRQIARLLAALRAHGGEERTVIVVGSDHGEELFDHDDFHGHYKQVTQSVLHVPLIVAGPGVPRGRRLSQWVENVDILPTVHALTRRQDEPLLADVSGRDLSALWNGKGAPSSPARAQREPYKTMPGGFAFAAVEDTWKLQWYSQHGPRLYDLARDPMERKDVSAAHADVLRHLSQSIQPWMRKTEQLGFRDPHALDPHDVQVLKALGYVQ